MNYRWIFPRSPINLKGLITFGESWNNINVSSVVPIGTKALLIYMDEAPDSFVCKSSVRPKGSIDMVKTKTVKIPRYEQVNIDTNYIFEGYFPNDIVEVSIMAYLAPFLPSKLDND